MSMINDSVDIGQKCVVFNTKQENVLIGTVQGWSRRSYQDYDYYANNWIQPISGGKEDCFAISERYVVFSFEFHRFLQKAEILVNPYKGKRGVVLDVPCHSRAAHPDKYQVEFYVGREKQSAWFNEGELRKYEEDYFEEVGIEDPRFKNLFDEELKRYHKQRITDRLPGIPDYNEWDGGINCPYVKVEELLDFTEFERALTLHLAS